ncbi:HDOD domain-containing protein [Desulforhopalus sp. 52FAK]
MTNPKPLSIAQQVESFPLMPITVSKVIEVTNNPESCANDLVKAVLPDQTMCIAILKMANSALYGRPKKVASLETAVTVLGFNEVQNIVLAKATVGAFKQIPKKSKQDVELLWSHSFTCGLSARIIAEHINQDSGLLFIAGLLHDIGKLAMMLILEDRYESSRWLPGLSSQSKLDAEKENFTLTHDEVGGRLLKHWQFPDRLIEAVNYHHTPVLGPGEHIFPLILQLADFLSLMYEHNEAADEKTLKDALSWHLPDFEDHWRQQKLPLEDISLESWYNWLKVDIRHGSEILDILAF